VDSKNTSNILQKGLEGLLNDITENLYKNNRVASGKTAKSLKVVMDVKPDVIKGQLLGSSVLEQLEYGRGKTKNAGSNASWESDLRNWMRIRGIDQSAFYPIWRKINAEGYEGTKGLISDPITKFKNNFAKQLKTQIVKDFSKNGINSNQ